MSWTQTRSPCKGYVDLERQGFAMRWASYLALPAISAGVVAVGLTVAPTASAECQVLNGSVQCGYHGDPNDTGLVAAPVAPAQYPCIDQWDTEWACNELEFSTDSMHYMP